jgi:hypothetical protein
MLYIFKALNIVNIHMKKENRTNLSLAEFTENIEFYILFFAMNYETA